MEPTRVRTPKEFRYLLFAAAGAVFLSKNPTVMTKQEVLDLPHLQPWVLDQDQKEKITDTGGWNWFVSESGLASPLERGRGRRAVFTETQESVMVEVFLVHPRADRGLGWERLPPRIHQPQLGEVWDPCCPLTLDTWWKTDEKGDSLIGVCESSYTTEF